MNGALAGYAFSAAAYAASLISGSRIIARLSFAALAAGLVLNIAALAARWTTPGHAPLAGLPDVLPALAAAIAGLAAAAEYRRNTGIPGLFAGIASALLVGYAAALDGPAAPLVPALRSNLLVFHVGAYIVGYAACAVAFATGSAYLAVCGRPHCSRQAAVLERLTGGFILFGFPFLTAGMSLGMVWAEIAWGRYWGWDPKESWSLIAWLIYGYGIHMRLLRGWAGRKTALLSVAGFAAVLFTLFGVNFLLGGLHSYR